MNIRPTLIESYILEVIPNALTNQYDFNLLQDSESNDFQNQFEQMLSHPAYQQVVKKHFKDQQTLKKYAINICYSNRLRSWGLGLKPNHFHIEWHGNNNEFCSESLNILDTFLQLLID